MELKVMHFAHPLFLLALFFIPIMWALYFLFYKQRASSSQLEKFIDKHLLPHLLLSTDKKSKSYSLKALLICSLAWSLLTLALAGPRWNLKEIEGFSKDQSLVIALDLSESMNASDIKPSRLVRAKQKIEDLLNLSKGVKIGLIAFAADAHLISPLTEDKETIRYLLASLETSLMHVQGSRLTSALNMASNMLKAEPGNNKALLIISDGGGEDISMAIQAAKKMAEENIVTHVMGIGTVEGAPLGKGAYPPNFLTKLERARLKEISHFGKGRYLEAHYSDHEEALILKELETRSDIHRQLTKKHTSFDEGFYLVLIPVLPILLWWFQRGSLFIFLGLLWMPIDIHSLELSSYFMNSEELGKKALEESHYDQAVECFQDPYRKGVAYYKAKNFAAAEKMFRESTRQEVALQSAYNLGNCLVQQQKLKEALNVYEEVLKKWPDYTPAKDNLALVKKALEQPQKANQDQKNSQDNQDSQGKQSNQNSKNSKDNQDSQDKQGNQNSKNSKDNQDSQDKQGNQNSKNSKHNQDSQGNQDNKSSQNSQENPPTPSEGAQNPSKNQEKNSEQAKQEKKENHLGKDLQNSDHQADSDQRLQGSQHEKNESPSSKHEDPRQDKEGKEASFEPKKESLNNPQEKKGPEAAALKEHKEATQSEDENLQSDQTLQDQEADFWLNRLSNDPKVFLKNKFTIESKKNQTTEGIDPW